MKHSKGDLLLLVGTSLFASWTLYCYVMVLSGAGFHTALTYSFVPFIVGLLLSRLCLEPGANRRRARAPGTAPAYVPLPALPQAALPGVLAIAIGVLFYCAAAYWIVWTVMLCTALLVIGTGFRLDGAASATLPPSPPYSPLSSLPGERIAVAAIALFCAVLTAVTHRPDFDDSQYLNFIVTALDFPVEPLFSRSGLWADHSVPLELPLYRFHSYELLIGALSSVSRVDHKVFYYLLFPPLFAALAVLVHWRLAQYLAPRYAVPILLVWVVLLIALGEPHRAFGNFAFVRLYQGKSVLLTVALPYCLLMALQFAEAPARSQAIALGVAVLASLGLSSSALATVPIAIAAALMGGLVNASGRAVKKIVIGGLASTVVLVAIAIYVMTTMALGEGNYGTDIPSAGTGLATVLGNGVTGSAVLALFPLAPFFVQGHKRRRLYAAATVFFVAFVLNPWASPFAARMFDLALQWRLFWPVPLLFGAAMAMAGVAALVQMRLPRIARAAVLPAVVLATLLLSSRLSISPANNVEYAWPRFKVEPQPYQLAAEITRAAAPRSTVYAPTAVSAWLATFRAHPYAISFRPDYLYFGRVKARVGYAEIERRLRVIRFLEGTEVHPDTLEFFKQQIVADQPSIVAYPQDILMADVIGSFLGRNGYTGVHHGSYWLWQKQ